VRDVINACEYIFLRDYWEPEENALRIVIEEAKANGPLQDILSPSGRIIIRDTVAIESDPTCRVFALEWPSYVAYCVRNESFTSWDNEEAFEGRHFRVYSKSHFRDYVARGTFATDDYPGPLKHWCIVCQNHLVDVVGCVEPEISRLSTAEPGAATDRGG
jgi:hypothetical protein